MADIHDRMPVILPASAWDEWLDPVNTDVEGLERVRFPSPVRAGGRVRGRGTLVSATPVGDDAAVVQAVVRVTIEADGGGKPACVADAVIRFYRESEAADA